MSSTVANSNPLNRKQKGCFGCSLALVMFVVFVYWFVPPSDEAQSTKSPVTKERNQVTQQVKTARTIPKPVSKLEQKTTKTKISQKSFDYSPFTKSQVCKAGIATIFGRDPLIMKSNVSGDVVLISYVRQNDGTVWENKCKIIDNRILWGSETGRWRTEPENDVVTFSVLRKSNSPL